MTNLEIINNAKDAYFECLEDHTYCDRYEAAKNAMENSIVADVWKNYGILYPAQTIGNANIKSDISRLCAVARRDLGIER